jgi:hypothetical protein
MGLPGADGPGQIEAGFHQQLGSRTPSFGSGLGKFFEVNDLYVESRLYILHG